jgi:Ferric reductase like transmembrane component
MVNFHGLSNCESLLSGPTVVLIALIVYMWFLNGTARSRLSIPGNSWGLVALCAVDLLFLSSLSFVRKRMYTLFIIIHVTCVIVILLAVRHFIIFHFFL